MPAFGLSTEIERNLISQRIKEALARKKADRIKLGRPLGSKKQKPKLAAHREYISESLHNGASQAEIARNLKVHRHTVKQWVLQNQL